MHGRAATTAGLVALAVVASGTSAYAYWTVYGEGTSTASVATVKPLVISPVAITGMVIDVPEDLSGRIENPNEFEADIHAMKLTMKVSIDRKHRDCSMKNFKVVLPTTAMAVVPALGQVPFGEGTIKLVDSGKDQSVCQGAVLTLDYLLK